MKRTKSMVLALVAVFALSVVVASAATAHEFNAKPTGGTFPAATSGTGGTQKFKSGFGTITCASATSAGRILSANKLTLEQSVIYTGCSDELGDAIDSIKALYEISADEKVSILAPIPIKFLGIANCTITIEKQNNLGGIKFKNSTAKIELTVESTTTGIVELGSGGFCTNGTGEYTGNITSHLTGGGELFWS
jgi:hypothetical protein